LYKPSDDLTHVNLFRYFWLAEMLLKENNLGLSTNYSVFWQMQKTNYYET